MCQNPSAWQNISYHSEALVTKGPTLCFRRTISWERRIRPWSRAGCRKETTDNFACGQSPGPCDPAYSVTGPAESSEGWASSQHLSSSSSTST